MSSLEVEKAPNIEATLATVRERVITQRNRKYIYKYVDVAVHGFEKDSEVVVLLLPLEEAKKLRRLLPKLDAVVTDILARKNKIVETCPDLERDIKFLEEANQLIGELGRKITAIVDIAELKKREQS